MKKKIYIIKNDINNKVYIGQAINVKNRFQNHCKPSSAIGNNLISRAIQKYGKKHFRYEIIEETNNYNEREQFWIEHYNSIRPNGYNICTGGEEPPCNKGVFHPEAAFVQEDIDKIAYDLKNTSISIRELADKYMVSPTTISDLNQGRTYVRDITYPIRVKPFYSGKINDDMIKVILHQLRFTYKSFEEISKEYNVEARAISRINKGLSHKQPDIEYPIRTWKASKSTLNIIPYEKVTEIIKQLQSTNKSLRKIANDLSVNYRDIVEIKNGTKKMYRRNGIKYPLRPNN